MTALIRLVDVQADLGLRCPANAPKAPFSQSGHSLDRPQLQIKCGIHLLFFLISPRKHILWGSTEVPRQGASNEYPRHIFSWRNKKKYVFFFQLKIVHYLQLESDKRTSFSERDTQYKYCRNKIGHCTRPKIYKVKSKKKKKKRQGKVKYWR